MLRQKTRQLNSASMGWDTRPRQSQMTEKRLNRSSTIAGGKVRHQKPVLGGTSGIPDGRLKDRRKTKKLRTVAFGRSPDSMSTDTNSCYLPRYARNRSWQKDRKPGRSRFGILSEPNSPAVAKRHQRASSQVNPRYDNNVHRAAF